MSTGKRSLDISPGVGIAGAAAIFVLTQVLGGGSIGSLWQPTAALVGFGGTFVAVSISFPSSDLRHTFRALRRVFSAKTPPIEPVLDRIFEYSRLSRRRGLLVLETEIDRAPSPFIRAALSLAVDGTSPVTTRQILDVENHALLESDEKPAEVLEVAAGYAPTLGILGAVLGLIHTMQSLTEPSRLGPGIAVAFVATVYGVGAANLVLLPLATRLRGLARHSALERDIIIDGMVALQEGLHPRLLEQKLSGYLPPASVRKRQLAGVRR
jgi:chemotaxis protein MotA